MTEPESTPDAVETAYDIVAAALDAAGESLSRGEYRELCERVAILAASLADAS